MTEVNTNSNIMSKLSLALDICAPVLEGKILYLDYPVYTNVGDLLIWAGAKVFLKRNKKKIIGQYSINNTGSKAKALMEDCSTICFQGGGNLGDLWPHHQKYRENIIKNYPHKRIVIMPQTIYFKDDVEMDKACAIFKQHPDLHIFVRGEKSLKRLQSKDVANVQMCPDMAHALWGQISRAMPVINQPLYLLRRDQESAFLSPEVLAMKASSIDWDDIFKGYLRYVLKTGIKVDNVDARLDNHLPAFLTWDIATKLIIQRAIKTFERHDTIITNRMHAVILALLMDRKVVVYDNSYGKLSSYITTWLSDNPNVQLSNAIDV